jgi:hypothetical protein
MPDYDPVNYPAPLLDDLTHEETGRGPGAHTEWRDSPNVPERYAGPPASREYETAVLGGRGHAGRALTPDPAPSEQKQQPTDPLPGAQPAQTARAAAV